jgi:hypothetical protein
MATKSEIEAAAKLLMTEKATRVPALQAAYQKKQGELQLIVNELAIYGETPGSVPKAKKSVVTPEIEARVKTGLAGKTMTAGQFSNLLGITNIKKAGDARQELIDAGIIKLREMGGAGGRGGVKYIWLAEEEMLVPERD